MLLIYIRSSSKQKIKSNSQSNILVRNEGALLSRSEYLVSAVTIAQNDVMRNHGV